MTWEILMVRRTLEVVAGAEGQFLQCLLRRLEPLGKEAVTAIADAVTEVAQAALAEAAALEAEGQLNRLIQGRRDE